MVVPSLDSLLLLLGSIALLAKEHGCRWTKRIYWHSRFLSADGWIIMDIHMGIQGEVGGGKNMVKMLKKLVLNLWFRW